MGIYVIICLTNFVPHTKKTKLINNSIRILFGYSYPKSGVFLPNNFQSKPYKTPFF